MPSRLSLQRALDVSRVLDRRRDARAVVPVCAVEDLGPAPCRNCPVRSRALCAGLGREELDHLARVLAPVHRTPAAKLFDEGDDARYCYVVTHGVVKTFKALADGRRQVTGFLGGGDFLGLNMDGRYAYSAEAVDAVDLCRFPCAKLEQLMARSPAMETHLLGTLRHELAEAQTHMLLLGRKTAKERVASFLLALSQRGRGHDGWDGRIALPMNRGDIADYLGLTTETVSRTLSWLRHKGVVSIEPSDAIQVHDEKALTAIADGEWRETR